jgi:hypothetical protein
MKQQAVRFKFIRVLFGLSLLTSGLCQYDKKMNMIIADRGCNIRSLDMSTMAVTTLNWLDIIDANQQRGNCHPVTEIAGKVFWVANLHSIYKYNGIFSPHTRTLVAGSGLNDDGPGEMVNGPKASARFGIIRAFKPTTWISPYSVLIADQFGIRQMSLYDHITAITTLTATPYTGYNEGSGSSLQARDVYGLDVDPKGTFAIFYDGGSKRVRKLHYREIPVRSEYIAGSIEGNQDGTRTTAQFGTLKALAFARDGLTVYGLQDFQGIHTVRVITLATGQVRSIPNPMFAMDDMYSIIGASMLLLDDNSLLIAAGSSVRKLNIQTGEYSVYSGNPELEDMTDSDVPADVRFWLASGMIYSDACEPDKVIINGYCKTPVARIPSPVGQYWNGASNQPCPAGSYCTGGAAPPVACTTCTVGKFIESGCISTQNVVCIACPAGSACPDPSSKVTCERMLALSDIYPPFASYSTTYFTSATSTVNFYLAGRLGLKETLTYAGAPFGNGVYEIFFSTKDDYYGTAKSVWFDGLSSTYARFRGNTYDSNGVYSGANYLDWEDYTGEWIAVKFLSPRKISGYKLTTNDVTRAFGHFKMYGSTDGAGFQEITQGTTSTKLTAGDYVSVAPDAYQYTRQFEATSTEYLYVGFTVHEVTTNAASIQMSDIFFMTPGPIVPAPPLMGQANYCPAGSTSIALCPAGSFCTDAASIAACTGYCPVGSPASQACSQCGTGNYATSACTSTTDAVCTACKSCGAGSRVTTACSATSDAVCQACVSGSTYSTTTNAATCQACTPCALGTYSLAACTSTSNAVCTACTICGAGSRMVTACGTTSNTVCQQCVSGSTYSTMTDAETCDVCSPCSVGMYTLTACTTSSQTICQHCPAGNYCPNPRSSTVLPCTICDGITKYAAPTCTLTTNSVCQSCTTCTPGNYVASGCNNMEDKVCSACPSGAFSTVLDALSCTPCSQCSAGDTYTSRPCTATSQTECTACITCPANTYTSQPCTSNLQAECTACITCATGYYASTPCTSTSQTVCTPCTTCAATLYASSQCTSTTNTVCSPCPAGTFNTADSTSPAVCQGSISPSS